MALSTRYLGLADQSSSSLSSDCIATLRNTTYENSCTRIKRDPTVGAKFMALCYGPFDPSLKCGLPELLVLEYRYQIYPLENNIRKLVKNLEHDQTVGSKVMALLTRYSSLANQSSSSLSSDCIATLRNTTYENSCKRIKRDPTEIGRASCR